jgi:nucleoside-diphosphate-sugar epimerase
VVVFELKSKRTKKIAKKYSNGVTIIWGNILDKESITEAVKDINIVIHLVALIPPKSEENKDLCFKLNVDGIRNVLEAIKTAGNRAKLIFTSSASVMGPTQHKVPPINPYDPPVPTSNYTKSKIEAEELIKNSGVIYCICRLGAVLSSQAKMDFSIATEVFNMNLDNRIEAVLDLDVATAIVNASELFEKGTDIHGKILNIGGGKENGFQIYGRDMGFELFKDMGIGALNPDCFSTDDYFIDWMDTKESQSLLKFQNHSYNEAMEIFVKPFKKFKPILKVFGPIIRKWLEKQSPYC